VVFSDLFFLFVFLPAFAVCYLLAAWLDKKLGRKNAGCEAKNWVFVFFSLIFYAWGEPSYVFLLIGSVIVNFLFGKAIEHKRTKLILGIGIAFNVCLLMIFKYLGFLVDSLVGIGLPVKTVSIALPIGISFYTFQSISYLIDVYRQESPAQRKFHNFLLYISMFPQLIAGPIVRYSSVAIAINERHVCARDIYDGLFRFFVGLAKKVIFANQLYEISNQTLGGTLEHLTGTSALVGLLAFSLQIYFDFSGYSDMAIGIGKCLGFKFPENFNHPYCCNSITDFWRRWHISLGSWFRDYVYIPLGGNRRHQALNIFVVWFLTGIWHGASWNFVIWGLYFGLIVMLEKYTVLKLKIPAFFLHIYSLVLVLLGWGIFYFDDFGKMKHFFSCLFDFKSWGGDLLAQSMVNDYFWLWIAAIILCLPARAALVSSGKKLFSEKTYENLSLVIRILATVIILGLSVAMLVGATNNAFIYTRF